MKKTNLSCILGNDLKSPEGKNIIIISQKKEEDLYDLEKGTDFVQTKSYLRTSKR